MGEVGERSSGGREYVLAFGPADPEAQRGYLQISVHQCSECAALVVEDFMPDHERWHEQNLGWHQRRYA